MSYKMEITIAGYDYHHSIVLSDGYIYSYKSTLVMMHDMKGTFLKMIKHDDSIYMMLPINGGVLFNNVESIFTISHDGVIRSFTDMVFDNIYDIAILRNGNVAILTDVFLFIFTGDGDLLIKYDVVTPHKRIERGYMTVLSDGCVAMIEGNFAHIYTSKGKIERPIYVGHVDDESPFIELFDGRFSTIVDNKYLMTWPRGNGTLSYSSTPVSFDTLTQLFDGRLLTVTIDSIDIYTVEGVLDKRINGLAHYVGIFQLPDSRLLLVSDRYITIYMLDGTIDCKFNCGELIQTVTFDDKDKLVYICEDDTMRIFTVPPKRSVYKPRLDMLSDMNVRFK